MAHLVRLIALFATLFAAHVHAAFPAPQGYSYGAVGSGGSPYSTISAYIAAYLAPRPHLASMTCNAPFTNNLTTCTTYNTSGSPSSVQMQRYPSGLACPSNSTLSGSQCTCTSPYVQNAANDGCEAPPDPCNNFGQLLSSYNGSVQMVKGVTSACMGGCQVNFKAGYEGADLYGAGTDGVMRGWVPVGQLQSTNTQGSCASPTEPVVAPVPDIERPPAGTCPGEINGVTVNVPCSKTESKVTKATTDNDGAGNTTNKTESRSTVCIAVGSCSTTVTTTTTVNGGTPTTSTKTTTQRKGQFCAENPGANECGDGDGSAFGGSCDVGFQCEGDAVQCALAKEVHTQHCKLNKVTDESTLYGAEKGRDGDQTGDLPGNETIPFGPSSFDDSDALGGGACLTDLTLTNQWIDATLPLSAACSALEWFRYLLLAVGSFAWMLIVFRK